MKVKIFYDEPAVAEAEFNKWAKGKALARDVIIHTTTAPAQAAGDMEYIFIVVYYPEGSQFDT